MSKLIKSTLAMLLVSLALALPAKEAKATPTTGYSNCTVFNVQFASPTTSSSVGEPPRLILHCTADLNTYVAYYAANTPSCPYVALPQVQVWNSMAAAAYVSGKQVTIFWSQDATGCTERLVTSVSLQPPA